MKSEHKVISLVPWQMSYYLSSLGKISHSNFDNTQKNFITNERIFGIMIICSNVDSTKKFDI